MGYTAPPIPPHPPAYAGIHGCLSLRSSLLRRMKPRRDAQRVSFEASAKEDTLRRGVAEEHIATTTVKPWGSTPTVQGGLNAE